MFAITMALCLTILLLVPGLLSPIRASSPGVMLEKTWGGSGSDVANAIIQDGSGVYIVGSTNSYGAGGSDVLVLKYDNSGNLAWRTTWGTANSEYGTGIALNSSGDLYVSGYTRYAQCEFGDCVDALLLKLDSGGNPVWARTWGNGATSDGEYAYGILTYSDSILLTGETAGGAGKGDIFILEFNSTGSLLSQQVYFESSVEETGRAMIMDTANNVFLASTEYNSFLGRCRVLILKFSSSLSPLARWEVDGSKCDEAYAISRDLSDNLYVTGRTTSFGSGGQDVFLLKLRPTGQAEWVTAVGGTGNETGYGIAFDPRTNNSYVVGTTNSYPLTPQYRGALLLKFNSTGDLQSSKVWEGIHPVDEAHATFLSLNPPYFLPDWIPLTGYVSEPPEYAIIGGPNTVETSGWGVGITTFSTINPKYDPLSPSGTTQHPLGVESYGGQNDVFLLLYTFAPLLTPSIPGFLGILAVTATVTVIRLSKRTFAKR